MRVTHPVGGDLERGLRRDCRHLDGCSIPGIGAKRHHSSRPYVKVWRALNNGASQRAHMWGVISPTGQGRAPGLPLGQASEPRTRWEEGNGPRRTHATPRPYRPRWNHSPGWLCHHSWGRSPCGHLRLGKPLALTPPTLGDGEHPSGSLRCRWRRCRTRREGFRRRHRRPS